MKRIIETILWDSNTHIRITGPSLFHPACSRAASYWGRGWPGRSVHRPKCQKLFIYHPLTHIYSYKLFSQGYRCTSLLSSIPPSLSHSVKCQWCDLRLCAWGLRKRDRRCENETMKEWWELNSLHRLSKCVELMPNVFKEYFGINFITTVVLSYH